MPPDEIIAQADLFSVMSGPTLAPIAAQHLTDEPDVIVGDMGGTTFDVSAIRDGQLVVTPEAMIGHDMLGIPKVDVRSIGAGGGSIAWVDVGGLLRVGPQSAGARPGPACYGQGGTEPTVTDANVLLGIIDPGLLPGRPHEARPRGGGSARCGRVAERLGVGRGGRRLRHPYHQQPQHDHRDRGHHGQAKASIRATATWSAAAAPPPATSPRWPRCWASGRFMIPKFSAGLSAYGGLISDVRWEESAVLHTGNRRFDLDGVNAILERLRRRG